MFLLLIEHFLIVCIDILEEGRIVYIFKEEDIGPTFSSRM